MKRILIVAAGGGYDILTVHLAAWAVQRRYPECTVEIGGMLNPKFRHFYFPDPNTVFSEAVVRQINGLTCVRFRVAPSYEQIPLAEYSYAECMGAFPQKDFPDGRTAAVSEMTLYHLSPRLDTDALVSFLCGYDRVFFCDVGGDFLYAGAENREVQTPLMDAYALVLAKKCTEQGTDCRLWVIAPGSDRELSPAHLRANLLRVGAEYREIPPEDAQRLWEMYLQVRTGDHGKTIRHIHAAVCGETLTEELKQYGNLLHQTAECDLRAAVSANPLALAENWQGVLQIGSVLLGRQSGI